MANEDLNKKLIDKVAKDALDIESDPSIEHNTRLLALAVRTLAEQIGKLAENKDGQ